MTGDGLNALAYDAENRLLTNTDGLVTTYGYDAKNLRVTKAKGGTTTAYIFSGGKVIAEYANGSLANEYVYLDDKLLATHSGSTLTYHHQDHLSVRVNTEGTSGAPGFGQVVGEQGTIRSASSGTPPAAPQSGCSPPTSGIRNRVTTTPRTVSTRTVWAVS